MAALDRAEPLAKRTRVSEGDVMRTLRVALAATVILALLGGLGGPVFAQAEEDAPPTVTQVTGEASPVFEGYIFEAELPPMPEPLEPSAE